MKLLHILLLYFVNKYEVGKNGSRDMFWTFLKLIFVLFFLKGEKIVFLDIFFFFSGI